MHKRGWRAAGGGLVLFLSMPPYPARALRVDILITLATSPTSLHSSKWNSLPNPSGARRYPKVLLAFPVFPAFVFLPTT